MNAAFCTDLTRFERVLCHHAVEVIDDHYSSNIYFMHREGSM